MSEHGRGLHTGHAADAAGGIVDVLAHGLEDHEGRALHHLILWPEPFELARTTKGIVPVVILTQKVDDGGCNLEFPNIG